MELFGLLQNELTYVYLNESSGGEARVHLDYEVSGFDRTYNISYELCIYNTETCGIVFNDLGAPDAGLGDKRCLEQLEADCFIIETMLNNTIRNGTIV